MVKRISFSSSIRWCVWCKAPPFLASSACSVSFYGAKYDQLWLRLGLKPSWPTELSEPGELSLATNWSLVAQILKLSFVGYFSSMNEPTTLHSMQFYTKSDAPLAAATTTRPRIVFSYYYFLHNWKKSHITACTCLRNIFENSVVVSFTQGSEWLGLPTLATFAS